MILKQKKYQLVIAITGLLLIFQGLVMQFSNTINWSLFDFLIAAILLLLVGFSCVFITSKTNTKTSRYVLLAGIIILFALIWAELGVGLFGTPFAGN